MNRRARIQRLVEQRRRAERGQRLVDADFAAELEQTTPAIATPAPVVRAEPAFDQELDFG